MKVHSDRGVNVDKKPAEFKIHRYAAFLSCMTIVVEGQFRTWNDGNEAGFATMFATAMFCALGYILLALNIAEMSSALPFSGGSYGFVRGFLHPLFAFNVAMLDLVLNVFYVSATLYKLANMPINFGLSPDWMVLVYCLIVYLVALVPCLLGGRIFWSFNNVLGACSIVLVLIYILGSSSYVNFKEYSGSDEPLTSDNFMLYLPPSSCFYLGLQYLPLLSKFIDEPRKNMPRLIVVSVVFVTILSVGLIVTVISQAPGFASLGAEQDWPLYFGFSRIFGFPSEEGTDDGGASANDATYSAGIIYCIGYQSTSISESGFLPSVQIYHTLYKLSYHWFSHRMFDCFSFKYYLLL